MNYKIGIIGAGHIGQALARQLAKTNYQVMITSRKGAQLLKPLVDSIGGSLQASDIGETIAESDILFLAIPWGSLEQFATHVSRYHGKIMVDATNNIVSIFPLRVTDLKGKSSGEYVAELFAGQRVVKGFNTLPAPTLAKRADTASGNTVIILSGDDVEAKISVAAIAAAMGFATIDLGTWKEAGRLQDPGGALSNIELVKSKAQVGNR